MPSSEPQPAHGLLGDRDLRRLLLPLLLVLAGAVVGSFQGAAGAVLVLIGFAWIAARSLRWALPLYIIFSPFTAGLLVHHHHIALSDAMAIIMALVLLGKYRGEGISGWWERFFPRAFRGPVVLLLAIAVISLVHAESHSVAVIKILELVEFFVVVVAVAAELGTEAKAWWPTLLGLFGLTTYLALDGLEQFLLGIGPHSFEVFVGHVRAFGPFGQPNVFGSFMAQTLPLAIALYLFGPRGRYKPWLLVVIILDAFSVWSSISRGAWVSDIAAIGLMGIFVGVTRGQKALAPYAAYGVLLPMVLFGAVDLLGHVDLSHTFLADQLRGRTAVQRLLSITSTTEYDTQQRFLIWGAALRAIRAHWPTGVGMGEFTLWIRHHMPAGLIGVPPHAHDMYLELGADTGVVGIVAIIWLQYRWIVASVRAVLGRVGQLDAFPYAMALGSLGVFTAFIIQNWVDYMVDHGVIVPLLLAMGFIAALTAAHARPAPHE